MNSNYFFPIAIIVASNVLYNICAKSVPEGANPFAALLVTYLVAAFVTAVFLIYGCAGGGISQPFANINWSSVVLGFSIIGLEFGYIMAYRVGWNISLGSLIANICLAVLLVTIGVLFYKEKITLNQLIGIGLCLGGLIFIYKK